MHVFTLHPFSWYSKNQEGFSVICGHYHCCWWQKSWTSWDDWSTNGIRLSGVGLQSSTASPPSCHPKWEGPGFHGSSWACSHTPKNNTIWLDDSSNPENSISFQEVLVSQDIEALVHNMNHNTTIRNSQIMERINLGTACVLMMAHAAWKSASPLLWHACAWLIPGCSRSPVARHLQATSGGLSILFKF